MKNLLTALWSGEVYPFEECCRLDERMKELNEISDQCREKVTRGMDAEQLKALEDYEDSLYDTINYNMEKSFLHGVKFAVGFLIEALH